MLIQAVLGFALLETLGLAALLLVWADRVAGARLLAAFLIGISVWMTGNALPNWLGPDAEYLALLMLSTAPFTSVLFFHFCVVFCNANIGKTGIAAAYVLGAAASLFAMALGPGYIVQHPDIGWIAVANSVGWTASMVWVVLGIAGVSVLLSALLRAHRSHDHQKFRQIAAVTASCLWGMLCLAGYGIAVLDLPIYPFPLWGLPLYSLILVYGILRYGVFIANAWARRALVWALLMGLGALVLVLIPLLPFESRWLGGLAVAASVLALNGPVRRFAERLVYPGGTVSVLDMGTWRAGLQSAESNEALAQVAAQLLSARIGMQVAVNVGHSVTEGASFAPSLRCTPGPLGWTTTLWGWDAAPPGPRHVAELFGTVVAEVAAQLEQAQQFAARERERQLQARLAELGSLAATVAHDIRNPLNIISMAVASTPAQIRGEVSAQVARISNLTRDLLDYAKPWKLNKTRFDLSAHAQAVVMRIPNASLGSGFNEALWLLGDAPRIDQVLTNVLENARTAVSTGDGQTESTVHQIHVEAETTDTALFLHICDNGLGVPEEIKARLFEPFASRSPGGTGLGLAIAARIMAAHGGTIQLTDRLPWRTCFTLQFPFTSQL